MAFTSVQYEGGGKAYDQRNFIINLAAGDTVGSIQTGLSVVYVAHVTAIGSTTQATPTNQVNVLMPGYVGTSGTGYGLTGGTLAFQRYNGALGTVSTGTGAAESYFVTIQGYK